MNGAAKTILGRVGMKLCGPYRNDVEYTRLDVVTHAGCGYVAKKTTMGNEPPNDEYWQTTADATSAIENANKAAAAATTAAASATSASNAANAAAAKANQAAENAKISADPVLAAIEQERQTSVSNVQQEGTAQVQAVAQKGAEVLASIPQNYTEAMNAKAPVIVETMKGAICVADIAAYAPLHGLTLYGKTTQDGTPSPEAPVPLVSAGDGGSIGVTAYGKNLLPFSDASEHTVNGVVFTSYGDGRYHMSGTASGGAAYYDFQLKTSVILPYGQDITICLNNDTVENNATVAFKGKGTQHAFAALTVLNRVTTYTGGGDYGGKTIDTVRLYVVAGTTIDADVAPAIQVVSDPAFEPFKSGGNLTINTPNGLPGIPVESGGNYTDENGQQWICDEIDIERGVYIQRVKQVVFNGTEDWWGSGTIFANCLAFNLHANDKLLEGGLWATVLSNICQSGTSQNYQKIDMNLVGGYGGVLTYKVLRSVLGNVEGTNEEAVGTWKAFLSTQYANGTPVVAYYQINSPIETPIPADALAAYRALHTIKPNTTVYNDAGAGMAVKYAADTKGYIDKKIAAIAAATL